MEWITHYFFTICPKSFILKLKKWKSSHFGKFRKWCDLTQITFALAKMADNCLLDVKSPWKLLNTKQKCLGLCNIISLSESNKRWFMSKILPCYCCTIPDSIDISAKVGEWSVGLCRGMQANRLRWCHLSFLYHSSGILFLIFLLYESFWTKYFLFITNLKTWIHCITTKNYL